MKLELKQLAAWGASQLERSIERVAQLPKTKQRFVLEMIDTVLAQAGSAP